MATCQPNPEYAMHRKTIDAMKKRCLSEFTFVTRIYKEEKLKVIYQIFKIKQALVIIFIVI